MIRSMWVFPMWILFATSAIAQREDRPQARPGPPGGFAGPPGFHLMTALDRNQDGRISAQEIDNALAALQELDRDDDGKLSAEEIGWPPPFPGGFGRGGPAGPGRPGAPGFGGGPRRGDGPGFGGPGFPGFGSPANARPPRPNPDEPESPPARRATIDESPRRPSFFSADLLRRLDRDRDGRIRRSDIPSRMRDLIFGRVDTNRDGVIDEAELAALARSQGQPE